MSKFLDVNELVVDDEAIFVETLRNDVKFQGCLNLHPEVEVFETPQPLFGFLGDQRPESAEIIIRRKFVGGSSNDMGFKRTETGIKPIISEYDSAFYNPAWRDTLSQRYAENKYQFEMYEQGFGLTSKTANTDGTTTMEFVQIGEF